MKLTLDALDMLSVKVSNWMVERAGDDWENYIDADGQVNIDEDAVVFAALEKFTDEQDEEVFAQLWEHPSVQLALEEMRTVVEDQASNYRSHQRMWSGTIHQRLREVGMSVHDFI